MAGAAGGGWGQGRGVGQWREAQDSDAWPGAAQEHRAGAPSAPIVGSERAVERAAGRSGPAPSGDLIWAELDASLGRPLGRREAARAVGEEEAEARGRGPASGQSSGPASGQLGGPASGQNEAAAGGGLGQGRQAVVDPPDVLAGGAGGQGEGGEEDECVICMDGGKTHALIPCGHVVFNPEPEPWTLHPQT